MKHKYVPVLLLIGFIIAGVYGCGGGGGGGDVTVSGAGALALNAPSQLCVQCHAAAAASYALSLHNTQSAATCSQCHLGADVHAASGGVVAVATANPDATWGTLPAVVGSPRINNGCTTAACHGPAGRKPLSLAHDNTAVAITGNTAALWNAADNAQYVDMVNNQPQKAKCSGCHNAHDTTSRMSLFADYASSGHGSITGAAWKDDPWKSTGVPDSSGNATADQRSCQRCHLSTAFVAQVNGTRTGTISGATLAPSSVGKYSGSTSPSVIDVSSAVTAVGSNGNLVGEGFRYYFGVFDVSGNNTRDNTKQVLRCDGCHSDNTYTMRTATAVTPIYKDSSTNVYRQLATANPKTYNTDFEATLGAVDASGNAKIIFPDVGKSNLCINCHSGRNSGWAVRVDPGNFSNRSFMNPHYLVAAGVLYRTIGYQYTDVSANLGGVNYDNGTATSTSFSHKRIGIDPNYTGTTGTGGPCVGCHMYPARHNFSPVQKDATGRIIAVTSPTCGSSTSACHATTAFATELNDERERYESTLKAFEYQLQDPSGTYATAAKGFFYTETNAPNYFKTTTALTTNVTNWVTPGGAAGTGKPNMGAAVNFKIMKADPGAYTHNRRYAKRLIWDSINWLRYNNLNTTDVGLAIDALTNARAAGLTPLPEADRVNARYYLCGSSNTAVGAACPRP